MTKNRKDLAEIGVDYISAGALTHASPILDLSTKNLRPIEIRFANAREF